jgi:hypothetical protein
MNIKQEEIVPLADMLITSFVRDLAEIAAENSFYNNDFLTSFKSMTEEVRELERADVMLTEQKRITKALYLLADDLYQPIKIFEVVLAKSGLNTNLVPQTIANLKKRNIEGGLIGIKALIQIVNSNKDLLLSKSMKPTFQTLLETSFGAMTTQSNLQTKLIQDRQLLTNGNNGSYDALYNNYIVDLCKMGKAIYHGKAKAKEYTITSMLKKLHVNQINKK